MKLGILTGWKSATDLFIHHQTHKEGALLHLCLSWLI